MMATAMLEAGGRAPWPPATPSCPLVAALDLDVDVFVVECSSFRLAYTETFRAEAAVWLNFAPDHLDWHRSMATYQAAKARLWSQQRADDVAIGHAADPIVAAELAPRARPPRHLRADRRRLPRRGRRLAGPHGPSGRHRARCAARCPTTSSTRWPRPPACWSRAWAPWTGSRDGLAAFEPPRHRIELVASADGVDWYDDSKATTPHAAATAVRGFDRVVLIAGGRNKGLDLAPLG